MAHDNSARTADQRAEHERALAPTIFHEDWWLNAATGGAYEQAEVHSGGRLVARLPYVWSRDNGYRAMTMPSLTHVLGPAVSAGGKPANAAVRRDAIMAELISKLPRTDHFHQRCHAGVPETVAFQDSGYSTGVQFSFVIPCQEASATWDGMRDKARNIIRKSEKVGSVDCNLCPDTFVDFYFGCVGQRGAQNYYDRGRTLTVLREAHARGRVNFYGKRENGALIAAIAIINDLTSSYYFLSARSQHDGGGSVGHLVWNAISDAAKQGRVFDFEGANTRGSALFYSSFGAVAAPRYTLTRSSRAFRLSRVINNASTRSGRAFNMRNWGLASRRSSKLL